MQPVQIVRVGVGDEMISIPLFRMSYANSPDGRENPGGFFVTPDGQYGIVVDTKLDMEEAHRIVEAEIRRNAPLLAAAATGAKEQSSRPSLV